MASSEVARNRLRDRAVARWCLEHPVILVFIVALIARVVTAIVAGYIFEGSPVLDDQTYSRMAAEHATDDMSHWDAFTSYLFDRTRTLLLPLSFLYSIFGTHDLVAQLFVGMLGAGTAAGVTRLALERIRAPYAVAAGLVVALLPSQVLWSSLILKDGPVWFLFVCLALLTTIALRATGARLLALGVAISVLLFLMAYLREHSLVVAAWAIALASLLGSESQRLYRAAGGVLIALAIPWLVGIGPAGLTLVTNAGSLEARRIANAQNADSAFIKPPTIAAEPTAPAKPAEKVDTPKEAPAAITPEAPPSDPHMRALPRGIAVLLFEPVPWVIGGSRTLRMARLESIVWYPVLILAFLGMPGLIRDLRFAAFPLLAGGGVLVTYALTEGNIGTAYRHRGEFTWVVALAAGFGLLAINRWRARRTEGGEPSLDYYPGMERGAQ